MNRKALGVAASVVSMACLSAHAQWGYEIRPSNVYQGGYNVYSGGMLQGTFQRSNMYQGGYTFRGEDGKSVLFASPAFATRFSEEGWVSAVENRDVTAMANGAWELKAVETILGKVDEKTTSEAMFKAAAQVAVEQKNTAVLSEIVALCPACKSYQEDLKATGQSRGTASVVTMPQLVYLSLGVKDAANPKLFAKELGEMVNKLTPWQTPYLTPDLVQFGFRGLSTPEAENIAMLVNQGRKTDSPSLLAQAAVGLAGKKAESSCQYLDAKKMLDEATGLAVFMEDKKSLMQIMNICENEAFGLKDTDKAKAIADELKAMSGSRGGSQKDVVDGRDLLKPRYTLVRDTAGEVGPSQDTK